jgi:pyruvate kinase
MRRTKIIATVGPASNNDAMLDALLAAGVDVFRLNFSHGTHDSHSETYARIRHASERAGRDVAILQDLSGPKIRTGVLEGHTPIVLKNGETFRIATGDFSGPHDRVSTTYEGLARSVRPGDQLLLADGTIELRVNSSDGSEVITTVVDGGALGEHKGINAPGVELPASAITAKDVEDLRFGASLGVDMVAVSFVLTAEDMRQARQLLAAAGKPDTTLIAKLERPQALDQLDAILDASDAVMVARGDLGLEMALERVPRAQKDITRAACSHQIPVIVATQVLESMTVEARPTRAEVSDAANAVDDGVDAIMLAGETASGAFPARAVQTLDAIIRDAESSPCRTPAQTPVHHDHAQALCEAAVTLAERGDAQAIVAVTRGGRTARRLSALRPHVPILAATDHPEVARRLSLYWGVTSVWAELNDSREFATSQIGRQLVARGVLVPGAPVVLVSVNADMSRSGANFLTIQRL